MRLSSSKVRIYMKRWRVDEHLLAATLGVKGINNVEIRLSGSPYGVSLGTSLSVATRREQITQS